MQFICSLLWFIIGRLVNAPTHIFARRHRDDNARHHCRYKRTHRHTHRHARALPLTLSLPSRFAPSARLMVYVSPRALWLAGIFSCEKRGGGLTGQPMGPQVDIATVRTVFSTNRVDSRSFSSRCWAFRRTHTIADPVQPLGMRLALPLTLSLPSR